MQPGRLGCRGCRGGGGRDGAAVGPPLVRGAKKEGY